MMGETIYAHLLALMPPTALVVAIIRLLLRTDVRAVARERSIDSNGSHYTFAIHNAEELPLRGRITLRLEVILSEGRLTSEPTLLCGPEISGLQKSEFGESARYFEVVTPRLRAQSTWVLRCSANGKEGDVRLTVTYEAMSVPDTYKKPETWHRLGSDTKSQSEKRQWPWVLGGTLAALLTYLLPILFELTWPWPVQGWRIELDGVFIIMLLAMSGLAFWMCRQPPTPIILGHLGWERKPASKPRSKRTWLQRS